MGWTLLRPEPPVVAYRVWATAMVAAGKEASTSRGNTSETRPTSLWERKIPSSLTTIPQLS